MRGLVEAHPDLLTMKSLGKSVEGRDLWCITINNPKTGDDRTKPAMYVDGNIHGNEIQGGEACLYLIWYLAENRGRVESLRTLTDERALLRRPHGQSRRPRLLVQRPEHDEQLAGGKSPLDDDRDGQADEDGYDDLNGDGQITQMRRKDPGGRLQGLARGPPPARPGQARRAGGVRDARPGGDRQRRRRRGQ